MGKKKKKKTKEKQKKQNLTSHAATAKMDVIIEALGSRRASAKKPHAQLALGVQGYLSQRNASTNAIIESPEHSRESAQAKRTNVQLAPSVANRSCPLVLRTRL